MEIQGSATEYIGGGVTLIGQPTAAAVPVNKALLEGYDAWLFYERRYLRFEMYGSRKGGDGGWEDRYVLLDRDTGHEFDRVAVNNAGGRFHGSPDPLREPQPSSRAAVIMAAAGVDFTVRED